MDSVSAINAIIVADETHKRAAKNLAAYVSHAMGNSVLDLITHRNRKAGTYTSLTEKHETLALPEYFSRDGSSDIDKQFKDTEKAYGGEAAYEKAKAAGKTKLNYRQWIQVRTPAFKEWFGDWEASARIQNIKQALEQVASGADEGVAVGLRPDLAGIGGSADVSFHWGADKFGLSKILNRRGVDVMKQVLDTVAHGSIERSSKGKKTVVLAYGNGRAVLSLDEHGQQKTWLLTGWEEGRPDATGEVRTQSGATQRTPTFSRDALVAGLGSIIPSTKEASKVIDQETGEPMVVYHGTNRSFDTFDKNAEKRHIPLPGMFFTPDTIRAEIFSGSFDGEAYHGANIMPVFLSLKNMKEISADDDIHGRMPSERQVEAWLNDAKATADSAAILNWRDGSGPIQFVAFHPNQIKSAIGNTGAFSKDNDDIRYKKANESAGGLTREEAERVVAEFKRQYKAMAGYEFRMKDTAEGLYGRKALEREGRVSRARITTTRSWWRWCWANTTPQRTC